MGYLICFFFSVRQQLMIHRAEGKRKAEKTKAIALVQEDVLDSFEAAGSGPQVEPAPSAKAKCRPDPSLQNQQPFDEAIHNSCVVLRFLRFPLRLSG
jgi:hypothetical protein